MNDTIQHHGVMGMKWGKRKGKTTSQSSATLRAGKALDSKNAKTESKANVQNKKDYYNRSKMTDAQLNKKINRLQMEQRYKELVDKPFNDIAKSQNAGRNRVLKTAIAGLGAAPLGLINTGVLGGRYKVALSMLKYGTPAAAAMANAVINSGSGGGAKKKKKRKG